MQNHRNRLIKKLNEIGIKVIICNKIQCGFLSENIVIKKGALHINSDALISEILHEAGHLAILPLEYRKQASGDVSKVLRKMLSEVESWSDENKKYLQCGDCEATAWGFAFGKHCGIPEKYIINAKNSDAYEGDGAVILSMLKARCYFGINGLSRAGWCATNRMFSSYSGLPLYPELKFWIQE